MHVKAKQKKKSSLRPVGSSCRPEKIIRFLEAFNLHDKGRCRRCKCLVKKNSRSGTLYKTYSTDAHVRYKCHANSFA